MFYSLSLFPLDLIPFCFYWYSNFSTSKMFFFPQKTVVSTEVLWCANWNMQKADGNTLTERAANFDISLKAFLVLPGSSCVKHEKKFVKKCVIWQNQSESEQILSMATVAKAWEQTSSCKAAHSRQTPLIVSSFPVQSLFQWVISTESQSKPVAVSFSVLAPCITESVWPVYHPVSFSFCHSLFPQSLSPFLPPLLLPSSPQHLHRTLCPGQPPIIFTHQNVDELHFMRIENHKFCSAWTAPSRKSCFSPFAPISTFWTDCHIKSRIETGSKRSLPFPVQKSYIRTFGWLETITDNTLPEMGEKERHWEVERVSEKKIKTFTYHSIFLHVSSLSGWWHFSITLWASLQRWPRSPNPVVTQSRAVYQLSLAWTFTRSGPATIQAQSVRQSEDWNHQLLVMLTKMPCERLAASWSRKRAGRFFLGRRLLAATVALALWAHFCMIYILFEHRWTLLQ